LYLVLVAWFGNHNYMLAWTTIAKLQTCFAFDHIGILIIFDLLLQISMLLLQLLDELLLSLQTLRELVI